MAEVVTEKGATQLILQTAEPRAVVVEDLAGTVVEGRGYGAHHLEIAQWTAKDTSKHKETSQRKQWDANAGY